MTLKERKMYALKNFIEETFKSKQEIADDEEMSKFHRNLRSKDPVVIQQLIKGEWKMIEEMVESKSDLKAIKKKFKIK